MKSDTLERSGGRIGQALSKLREEQGRAHGDKRISWRQFSLIGMGSVIGAGFFLGTGLSISIAGPSVLIAYLLGGVTAYLVWSSLAEMSVRDPQPGSFRTYARQAFGPSAGFLSGWVYWSSGVLIMSSETAALSVFTRYWLPGLPLWSFAVVYSLLALTVVGFGIRSFSRMESGFAVVKLTTLVLFILFTGLIVAGSVFGIPVYAPGRTLAASVTFPTGFAGFASCFLYVLFSYGGIEVMGVMATELKNPADAARAGRITVWTLTAVYALSLFLALTLADWRTINESQSPFVTALAGFRLPYVDTVLNAVLISAAFSTMVGSLFAITGVMVSLAADGDAPQALTAKNRRGVPFRALLLSAAGLAVAVVLSYFLPQTVYEYLTTAAGVLLILNWTIMLASAARLRKTSRQTPSEGAGWVLGRTMVGAALILLAIAGGLLRAEERTGVLVSLAMLAVILTAAFVRSRRRTAAKR